MGNKDWFPFKRMPARGGAAGDGNVYAKRRLLARDRRLHGIILKLAFIPR
jgi:hypothetical protein